MVENIDWHGKWNIIIKQDGKIIDTQEIKNTIMNGALDELVKPLTGDTPDIELKYLALGTSSESVQTTQTTLVSEQFRTFYATRTTQSDQEVSTTFLVFDNEAQIQIEEIGIFGGSSASATTDSGTMISRILWSYDKTLTNIEIQFNRTDKVRRG